MRFYLLAFGLIYSQLSEPKTYTVYGMDMQATSLCNRSYDYQIIYLHTNKACLKCYGELEDFLKKEEVKIQNYHVECLALCNSTSAVPKRYVIDNLKENISRLDEFRFTFKDSSSIFRDSLIDKSPGLLILDNKHKTIKLYKYEQLYTADGYIKEGIILF